MDLRIQYPKFFLKNPQNNFLTLLKQNGYKINHLVNPGNIISGELPYDVEQSKEYDHLEAIKNLKVTENSLTLIILDDFHTAFGDLDFSEEAAWEGNRICASMIDVIDKYVGIDNFDLVISYSDHGCMMKNELKKMRTDMLFWMGAHRTKIFMYKREKGEKGLKRDNRLCSIMDIGPTICEKTGIEIPYMVDGYSLYGSKTPDYILIEDHKNCNVNLEQVIEYWGIRTKNNFAVTNLEKEWKSIKPITEEEKEKYERICKKTGSYYNENTRMQEIWNYYKQFNFPKSETYFDGTPRRYKNKEMQIIRDKIGKILRFALKGRITI